MSSAQLPFSSVDDHASCEETVSYKHLQNDEKVRSLAHSLFNRSMIIYSSMMRMHEELSLSGDFELSS